jgi:small subunit ribosomal protein S16
MRMGKKKQPTYRVVAADGRAPRNGRFIEILGAYDPRHEPSKVNIDVAKADDWIAKGAQPTERVAKLLEIARNQPVVAADAPVAEAPAPAPAPVAAPAPAPAPEAPVAEAETPAVEVEAEAEVPAAEPEAPAES